MENLACVDFAKGMKINVFIRTRAHFESYAIAHTTGDCKNIINQHELKNNNNERRETKKMKFQT